jgi:hypothetical protein
MEEMNDIASGEPEMMEGGEDTQDTGETIDGGEGEDAGQ